jgi:hypothetical protein
MPNILLSPTIVLSVLIVSGYSLLFYFLWGRTVGQLARYWVAGLIGFGLGQVAAIATGWNMLVIGDVHLIEGTLGCWLMLFIAKKFRM